MFLQRQHRQREVRMMAPASHCLLAVSRRRLLRRNPRPSATQLWSPGRSQDPAHALVRMFRLLLCYCISRNCKCRGMLILCSSDIENQFDVCSGKPSKAQYFNNPMWPGISLIHGPPMLFHHVSPQIILLQVLSLLL